MVRGALHHRITTLAFSLRAAPVATARIVGRLWGAFERSKNKIHPIPQRDHGSTETHSEAYDHAENDSCACVPSLTQSKRNSDEIEGDGASEYGDKRPRAEEDKDASDENASSDEDEGPYAELELMLKQAQRTVGKTSAQMQKTEVGELNVCVVAIATKNGGDPDEY